MLCYAGPFISVFRESMEELWRTQMKELYIEVSEKITMRAVLGNDVTFRQWAVAGLPSDNLSIENGIILFNSRRWPLMIDPSHQSLCTDTFSCSSNLSERAYPKVLCR